MSVGPLLSHPPDDDHPGGRPLSQHLGEVARVAELVLTRHPAGAFATAGFSTPGILRALAGWHDIGKGTAFFQDYISDPDAFMQRAGRGDPQADPHLKDHTPIGAFLALRHWSQARSRNEEIGP